MAETVHTMDVTERTDLTGNDAVSRIRSLVDSAESCFFCTAVAANSDGRRLQGAFSATRPMSVRKVDDDGTLWFLSAADSHKNAELTRNPEVELYFQGSPHGEFLHLRGSASITTDRSVISTLWSPFIKTWFTDGVDDPRLTAIRVSPADGYFWDTRHGGAVAGVKMLIGAAIGRTMDDSSSGSVRKWKTARSCQVS